MQRIGIFRVLFFLFFSFSSCFSLYSNERQKTVLVCGAGGFIGSHLVNRYKADGYWVRGVDIKFPEFSETEADEFLILDLRDPIQAKTAVSLEGQFDKPFDEVCQLAADMGGMGYISFHDAQIMHNSMLISLNVLKESKERGVGKILYTSSACVYPEHNQMDPLNPKCVEDSVYPANPDTEYGWEKLFSERVYQAYAKDYGMDIRIVRLHNIFGPYGTWKGGREKAPAALCRKVAEAKSGDFIEVWGRGNQTRSFLFIDECIEGISRIMKATTPPPIVNLGSEEIISINDLVHLIADIAHKEIYINNIPGPEGVRGRNSDNTLIQQVIGWQPQAGLSEGLQKLYPWIESQLERGKQD